MRLEGDLLFGAGAALRFAGFGLFNGIRVLLFSSALGSRWTGVVFMQRISPTTVSSSSSRRFGYRSFAQVAGSSNYGC